jgi:hypothetical protein
VFDFFTPKDPLLRELKRQLAVIDPRFREVEINEGRKSYTINKKKVYICLKDKSNRYYNRNMLVYVICHEYSHILCDEIGHTDKFFEIFDGVLVKAERHGLYDPSVPILDNYCGQS